jgi:hypothetical protein
MACQVAERNTRFRDAIERPSLKVESERHPALIRWRLRNDSRCPEECEYKGVCSASCYLPAVRHAGRRINLRAGIHDAVTRPGIHQQTSPDNFGSGESRFHCIGLVAPFPRRDSVHHPVISSQARTPFIMFVSGDSTFSVEEETT